MGLRRDLILRRPPVGAKAKSAHDMGREHDIQQALAPVFPYVATMVGLCRDESVIGSEFYVMERLEGTIPRRHLGFDVTPEQASELCGRAWDVLAELHAVDVSALAGAGRAQPRRGVRRAPGRRLDRPARAGRDRRPRRLVAGDRVARRTPARDRGQCLIHNDFRFDNLVLAPEDRAVTGVLDWEMATVGDPLMDLGGALGYWVEAGDDEFFRQFRRQPSNEPGMWTRWQIVEHYAARTGLTVTPEQWRFYEVFGIFRLAVIAQQIWFRYFHGQTHNEAYAVFGPAVAYLEQRCRRLLEL